MADFQSTFFDVRSLSSQQAALLLMRKRQLTEDENLEELDRDFVTLTDSFQVRKIVVDLTSVTFMTSAAIGKLISLHRRLARLDGRLVLCCLQPEVEGTLATSHLLTYFNVADTSDAATLQFS